MGLEIWQQGSGTTASPTAKFWTLDDPCGPDDTVPQDRYGLWART